jgi:Uncharacterized protein involved in exopolysaccharide biosynthesis
MKSINKSENQSREEITLIQLIDQIKIHWRYLLSKWVIILIFGLLGGALGLLASFLTKPKYKAHLSFALVEKNSGGGLADLASSFGLSALGVSGNGAFSGDNLLEIIKSEYAIEKTLLTPVVCKGKLQNLVEMYIDFSDLRQKWIKMKDKPELAKLSFSVGQKRETFTRTQDSVLAKIYKEIEVNKLLTIVRKDRKVSIVNVDFISENEVFSKLFIETLMQQTYNFYKQTKTEQSRININMMQHTADSIKCLYESALYKGASFSQANINTALQLAAVPRIKQENNAQLYGAVYAEVLKNLETLKLDMARETPLVQMIDEPRYPLQVEKLSKLKGVVEGGIFGGIFIVAYLLGFEYLKKSTKREINNSYIE